MLTVPEKSVKFVEALGSPPERGRSDVKRLLTVLRQHVLLLVLLPMAVLAGTLGYVMLKDPRYEISAQLLLQFGPELGPPPTAALSSQQQIGPQFKRLEDATAEVQILKDPRLVHSLVSSLGEDFFFREEPPVTFMQRLKHVAKSVVEDLTWLYEEALFRLGLRPKLTRLEKVVIVLQNSLQIEPVPKSEVIEIKLQYPDPEAGRILLKRYIEIYLNHRSGIFTRSNVGQFLSAETESTQKELLKARKELVQTRQALGAWSIEDQRRLLLESKSRLDQRRVEVAAELAGRRAELTTLNQQIEGLPPMTTLSATRQRNPVVDDLNLKRLELAMALDNQRARFGAGSREVAEVQQKLDAIEGALGREPQERDWQQVEGINSVRQTLSDRVVRTRADIDALNGQVEELQSELARIEADLSRLSRAELEIEQLIRLVERLERQSQLYQDGFDRARIADAVSSAKLWNVTLMADSQSSLLPVWPRLTRLFLIAGILAVGAAVGLVLMMEALRPRVRDNSDLAALFPDARIAAVPNLR